MVGKKGMKPGTQGGQCRTLVGGQGGEVGVYLKTHSAAFISKPSSILSDGTTG